MTAEMHMQDIHTLARKAQRRSREEFVADFPTPALVVDPYAQSEDDAFLTQERKGASHGLSTSVAFVRKRAGANAFASMVTVGRAANNDVQLKADSVSKFHAYMRPRAAGGYELVDANSTFGTRVGTEKLAPSTNAAALKSGLEVFFGSLRTTYYEAEDFYDMLIAYAGSSSAQ